MIFKFIVYCHIMGVEDFFCDFFTITYEIAFSILELHSY
jgi:hypothetical protein